MTKLGVFLSAGFGSVLGAIAGGAIGNAVRGKRIGTLTYGDDELIGAILGGATLAAISAADPNTAQPSPPPRFP